MGYLILKMAGKNIDTNCAHTGFSFNRIKKLHANSGGLYETKTIYAMIFRISITILLTVAAYYLIKKIKTADHKIT